MEKQLTIPYLHVVLASGLEKPYYLKKNGMSEKGCYLRVGSGIQKMTTSLIDEMYSKRTRNSLRNIKSPRKNLQFEQL